MLNLKAFRKVNRLTQQDVADLLGVSRSFVSQVEGGFSGMPEDKLSILLENKNGYDISSLAKEDGTMPDAMDTREVLIPKPTAKNSQQRPEMRQLVMQITILKQQLEEERERSRQYWALIQKLISEK